jgi:hypothetical protein
MGSAFAQPLESGNNGSSETPIIRYSKLIASFLVDATQAHPKPWHVADITLIEIAHRSGTQQRFEFE